MCRELTDAQRRNVVRLNTPTAGDNGKVYTYNSVTGKMELTAPGVVAAFDPTSNQDITGNWSYNKPVNLKQFGGSPLAPASGHSIYSVVNKQETRLFSDGFRHIYDYTNISATRTITVPDASGTLAFTSNLSGSLTIGVPLDGTLRAVKDFDNTTSPLQLSSNQVAVQGGVSSGLKLTSAVDSTYLLFYNSIADVNNRNWLVGTSVAGYGDFVINQSVAQNGNPIGGTTRFLIDRTGNIGIGTISPSGKFEVNGGGANTGVYFLSGNTANWTRFQFGRASAEGMVGISNSGGTFVSGDAAGDMVLRTLSSNILFSTDSGASAQLYLKNNGCVVLGGTTTLGTSAKLSVKGTAANDIAYFATNSGGLGMVIDASGLVGCGGTSGGSQLYVFKANDSQLKIDANGQYTAMYWANNAATIAQAYWNHNVTTFSIGSSHATGITNIISGNGVTAITISATQKVGIGTTPLAGLHANVDAVRISHPSYAGYYISMDINGGTTNTNSVGAGTYYNWKLNGTIKMVLDDVGNLLVGATSPLGTNARLSIKGAVANDIAYFAKSDGSLGLKIAENGLTTLDYSLTIANGSTQPVSLESGYIYGTAPTKNLSIGSGYNSGTGDIFNRFEFGNRTGISPNINQIFTNNTLALTIDEFQNATFASNIVGAGSITTGQPSILGAQAWKLGIRIAVSDGSLAAIGIDSQLEIEVAGSLYYLTAKQGAPFA